MKLNTQQKIAANLKMLRLSRNMKQAEFAEKLGSTVQSTRYTKPVGARRIWTCSIPFAASMASASSC